MPAFNHEQYIEEALDSILMQEVDFRYEIVIGEDKSTDNTRAIARRYSQKFPEIVKLIENEKNLGIWENDQVILAACHGEYIAWLESDDFWTSASKLKRQVDFLDSHSDYSACFHRAACLTHSEPPVTWRGRPAETKEFYCVDDLLEQGHFIPSCTMVFRADLVREPLDWTSGTPFLETAYAVRFALNGKIGFIDEELATYRYHSQGVYGTAGKIKSIQQAIAAHRLVGRGFGLTSRPAYRRGLASKYSQLSSVLGQEDYFLASVIAGLKGRWYTR